MECEPVGIGADVELSGSVDVGCTRLLLAVHGYSKINFTYASIHLML